MTDRLPFDADTLPKRRRGAAEMAMQRQLTAWTRAGHLTGDEHAGDRNTLMSSARNVDRANADTDVSPYARAMVLRIHNDLVAAHAPAEVDVDEDDLDPDPAGAL